MHLGHFLNASSLEKYQHVKDVTVNYLKTKQIFSKDPSKDPDAMEIGKVSKCKGRGKGNGDKVQNRQEPRFTCLKCGGQGHMAPQCPSARYNEKGKGKGKDFKGKGK